MAIKSILFNSDMVRAILDGRKTVTRRAIKPHNPVKAAGEHYRQGFGLWIDPTTDNADNDGHIKDYSISPCWSTFKWYVDKYAPYHIGDILYVRETWADRGDGSYMYKADYKDGEKFYREGKEISVKWKPSIHSPKEAARIFLRVTNVSVTKLQDITEEEAIKEGVTRLYDDLTAEEYDRFICATGKDVHKKQSDWGFTNYLWHGNCGLKKISPRKIDNWTYQYSSYDSARDSFSSLWESTVSCKDEDKYSWDANPWVWVIEFERTEKPKDF